MRLSSIAQFFVILSVTSALPTFQKYNQQRSADANVPVGLPQVHTNEQVSQAPRNNELNLLWERIYESRPGPPSWIGKPEVSAISPLVRHELEYRPSPPSWKRAESIERAVDLLKGGWKRESDPSSSLAPPWDLGSIERASLLSGKEAEPSEQSPSSPSWKTRLIHNGACFSS
ncbi:hypothetical protein BT96DRAFT_935258 [Gymnopus androsaceus JB14]|uniref:DUF4050 domain-containing protein n=1 Tax=Gymnopus androsaceus JB14 TaxID=1447944 RepID=A0A6A4I2R4_9AGAR|nr:hypothetical protein BT96DRAFT_935258 [Gymnopus androsaceus JB14]